MSRLRYGSCRSRWLPMPRERAGSPSGRFERPAVSPRVLALFLLPLLLRSPVLGAAPPQPPPAPDSPASSLALPPLLVGVHRVATMGASITQFGARPGGYVWLIQHYLDALYPQAHIEVFDVGVSGNTSGDMVARFRRDVIDRKADLVTIKAGFNDLTRKFSNGHPRGDGPGGADAGEYGRNVAAMADMAAAAHIRVLLMTPTIYEDQPDSIRNEKLKAYVEAVRALSRARRLPLADQNAALMHAWLFTPTRDRKRLTTDGVHMTLVGDAVLARTALLAMGIPAASLDAATPIVRGVLAHVRGASFRRKDVEHRGPDPTALVTPLQHLSLLRYQAESRQAPTSTDRVMLRLPSPRVDPAGEISRCAGPRKLSSDFQQRHSCSIGAVQRTSTTRISEFAGRIRVGRRVGDEGSKVRPLNGVLTAEPKAPHLRHKLLASPAASPGWLRPLGFAPPVLLTAAESAPGVGIPALPTRSAGAPPRSAGDPASLVDVPAETLPPTPVPATIALASRAPWNALDAPAADLDVQNPQWLSPETAEGVLTLPFRFPSRMAAHWSEFQAWAGRTFAPSSDLDHYDGFTFEARARKPSIDWTVDILLVANDGGTYLHRAAATLDRDGWVRGYALFRDFSPGPWGKITRGFPPSSAAGPVSPGEGRGDFVPDVWNAHLDPARITAVYFGSIHPAGGDNTFFLGGLELIKVASEPPPPPANPPGPAAASPAVSRPSSPASPAAAAPSGPPAAPSGPPAAPGSSASPDFPVSSASSSASPTEITVDPGVALEINGAFSIPPGIFGLDIPGPLTTLDHSTLDAAKDLRPGFVHLAHRDVAPSPPLSPPPGYAPGSPEEQVVTGTGAADWMLTDSAGDRRPDNNDAWANGVTADFSRFILKAPGTLPPPRLEVWSEPEQRTSMTSGAVTPDIQAMLEDPYAMGEVLGPVARESYSSIFDAVDRTVKAALPAAQVGGFSLPLPGSEDWRMWDVWGQPLLQRERTNLDFLTERHSWRSGGSYQANLMLLAAWSVDNVGRILPVYCPDAGALPDRAGVDPRLAAPLFAWSVADFEIRDILTMLREPDKVVGRASEGFPLAFAGGGAVSDDARRTPDYWAHYTLRDLRGTRLAATTAPLGDVEVDSSTEANSVVIAAYNHSNEARPIHIQAAAPHGAHYSAALERHFGIDPATGTLLLERGNNVPVAAGSFVAASTLSGHELVCYTLTASHVPAAARTLEIGDALADRWYLTLYPGRQESMRVYLTDLKDVTSASLRAAVQGIGYGNGSVTINGHEVLLPFASANAPDIITLPLDTGWIKPGENDVVFINRGIPGEGKFRLLAAAIRTVRETLAPRE